MTVQGTERRILAYHKYNVVGFIPSFGWHHVYLLLYRFSLQRLVYENAGEEDPMRDSPWGSLNPPRKTPDPCHRNQVRRRIPVSPKLWILRKLGWLNGM